MEREKDEGLEGALSLLWSVWQYEGGHQSSEDGQMTGERSASHMKQQEERKGEKYRTGSNREGKEEENLKQKKEEGKAEAKRE